MLLLYVLELWLQLEEVEALGRVQEEQEEHLVFQEEELKLVVIGDMEELRLIIQKMPMDLEVEVVDIMEE